MKYIEIRFCPLKGLIIMNFNDLFQFVKWEDEEPFPSPTGVNYYEYKPTSYDQSNNIYYDGVHSRF